MYNAVLQQHRAHKPLSPACALMQRETAVTYGPVPHRLFGEALPPTTYQMLGDLFLLRGEGSHYFYYEKGTGITVERGPDADISEEVLWLNGSLYSAIASMNGLVPIHASAVAVDGKVYAFTAPPGGGKSTLVAALSGLGLPMYCDDTLVLDLSDPGEIVCLPGHKRLKLTPDAINLTGIHPQEKVSKTVDKFYASPAAGEIGEPLPLAELIFLEEAKQPEIALIDGAERIARLQDDHPTSHLFALAQQFDRVARFEHLCELAQRIPISRFARPFEPDRFTEGVAVIRNHLMSGSQ